MSRSGTPCRLLSCAAASKALRDCVNPERLPSEQASARSGRRAHDPAPLGRSAVFRVGIDLAPDVTTISSLHAAHPAAGKLRAIYWPRACRSKGELLGIIRICEIDAKDRCRTEC